MATTTDLDKSYRLGRSIDLSGYDETNGIDPIGSGTLPFSGTFDGAGYSIANLKYSGAADGIGLFSQLAGGAVVRDLHMVNVALTVTDDADAGAISGVAGSGSAAAITVTGCSSTGTITGLGGASGGGGLVGWFDGSGATGISVTESWSSATVTAAHAGGLLGMCADGACSVTNCYSQGAVNAATAAGGLIAGGYSFDVITIANSYSSSPVASGSDGAAGGLVGRTSWNLTITNSFATGNVVCSAARGAGAGYSCGAIASDTGPGFSMTNSFYYSGATFSNDGGDGLNNGLAGMTGEPALSWFYDPLNAPMNAWDFATIWQGNLSSSALPTLR